MNAEPFCTLSRRSKGPAICLVANRSRDGRHLFLCIETGPARAP